MKYARETEVSIASSRRENRQKLFMLYPQLSLNLKSSSTSPDHVDAYREIFGQRVSVKCESLRFKLQVPIDEKETMCQIEPYHTSLCLYDAKAGRKLTENFHFDLNSDYAREMLPKDSTNSENTDLPDNVPREWILYPKNAVFNITSAHSDIFLVVRIEKVLQGGICQSTEPYIRSNKDVKAALKVQKSIAMCCQRLGCYRMPFAWTARPLFR